MYKRGLSLIEIIITIAILFILTSVTMATFQQMGQTAALKVSLQEVYNSFSDARNDTLASKNDTFYGVHIDTTELVYFAGATYSAGDAGNVVYPMGRGVTAAWQVSDGGDEIVFERLTGNASASGTITLTEQKSGKTGSISVYLSGLIEP